MAPMLHACSVITRHSTFYLQMWHNQTKANDVKLILPTISNLTAKIVNNYYKSRRSLIFCLLNNWFFLTKICDVLIKSIGLVNNKNCLCNLVYCILKCSQLLLCNNSFFYPLKYWFSPLNLSLHVSVTHVSTCTTSQ